MDLPTIAEVATVSIPLDDTNIQKLLFGCKCFSTFFWGVFPRTAVVLVPAFLGYIPLYYYLGCPVQAGKKL
jgi:hypothetical protein